MAEQEISMMKTHVETLATIPVILPNDHTPDPAELPRKIMPFPIDLPPPPVTSSGAQEGVPEVQPPINIIIRSSKPPRSFTLSVHPTDTISAIKEKLANTESTSPPADAQRLLLKGKVLADNKLLQEYDGIEDRVVLNLMVRSGSTQNTEERALPARLDTNLPQLHAPQSTRLPHTRSMSGAADQFPVPALTLSQPPSPTRAGSPLSGGKLGVPLDLINTDIPPRPSSPRPMSATESYDEIISSVTFWVHLKEFLDKEFGGEERNSSAAFEMFFLASKGSLTPHEIAKIRDVVGVIGMAGT
ncbi:uncharacterized protein EI90DRAFT_3030619 [Cantharellus anzutake]|uniref:uncharacterized protein n=1 Tax=Cantharellus anzutake TaxID=1750568 RepID=UPI001904AD35|nr:uncharacterized protein EI90DRAFT_3030619 [Cantharellus anzutake]KAF8342902.1 hypothetical protein EI90DRAFT_3030619 [Cantharellus anzutake]